MCSKLLVTEKKTHFNIVPTSKREIRICSMNEMFACILYHGKECMWSVRFGAVLEITD